MGLGSVIATRFEKGLNDFLLQRLTAVLLVLYTACIVGFFLVASSVDHARLVEFFRSLPMQLFSSLAFLAVWSHGSIGLLIVGKDYIKPGAFGGASVWIAQMYEVGVQIVLLAYAVWGLAVIWDLA